jgi:hypothetical protein
LENKLGLNYFKLGGILMENILAILFEYRYLAVAVVGFVVFAIFEYETLKKYINAGIVKAEKWAKEQTLADGQAKEDWIVDNIYPILPMRIKIFVKESMFRSIIRFFYKKLIDWLDDGKLNNSIS